MVLLCYYPHKMKKIWLLVWFTPENEVDKVAFAYIRAMENEWGILTYIIPCMSKNIDIYLQKMDGFLLPGWHSDVDPSLYWEKNAWSKNVYAENDKILIDVVLKVIGLWKPLLWICKGMQLINVALWGSLIQDVLDTKYSFDCIHNVVIDQSSRLFQLYKKTLLSVNSLHHQAVKQVGKWLIAVAHNEAWIIEAIESGDGKVLGVQWHPEYLEESKCLFRDFLWLID